MANLTIISKIDEILQRINKTIDEVHMDSLENSPEKSNHYEYF